VLLLAVMLALTVPTAVHVVVLLGYDDVSTTLSFCVPLLDATSAPPPGSTPEEQVTVAVTCTLAFGLLAEL
jgi:hypothetical protein